MEGRSSALPDHSVFLKMWFVQPADRSASENSEGAQHRTYFLLCGMVFTDRLSSYVSAAPVLLERGKE